MKRQITAGEHSSVGLHRGVLVPRDVATDPPSHCTTRKREYSPVDTDSDGGHCEYVDLAGGWVVTGEKRIGCGGREGRRSKLD